MSTSGRFRLSYPTSVDDPINKEYAAKVSSQGPSRDGNESDDSVESLPRSSTTRQISNVSSIGNNKKVPPQLKILGIDDDLSQEESENDYSDDDDDEKWEDAPEEFSPSRRLSAETRRRGSFSSVGGQNALLGQLMRMPSYQERTKRRGSDEKSEKSNYRRSTSYRRINSANLAFIPVRRRQLRRKRTKTNSYRRQTSHSGNSLVGSVESVNVEDFRGRSGSNENKDSLDARQRADFHNMVVRLVNSVNITGPKTAKQHHAIHSATNVQQTPLGEGIEDALNAYCYEIWVELKAWHQGVTPTVFKDQLEKNRQTINEKLEEIVDYRFTKFFEEGDLDVAALDVSQDMLAEEIRALHEVHRLLEKIADIEQLYPSMKMLSNEIEFYKSSEFTHRYRALCYWYNHCWTMHRQLKILAGIFQMSKPQAGGKDTGAGSTSSGAWWQSVVQWLCETAALRRRDTGESSRSSNSKRGSGCSVSGESDREGVITVPSSSLPSPKVNSDEMMKPIGSPTLFVRQLSASTYRTFVEKLLKRTAVSKLQKRLQDLVRNTPARVRRMERQPSTDEEYEEHSSMNQQDLQAMRHSMAAAMAAAATQQASNKGTEPNNTLRTPLTNTPPDSVKRHVMCHQVSFADDRLMHSEIAKIGLPSLKTTYLFLARVPLDVIHECVRFRLEQYLPCERPSELSIRQLLKECKEVLLGAVRAIDQYQRLVLPLLGDSSQYHDVQRILMLERFYSDIRQLLEIYFKYLSQMLDYLAESGGSEAAVLVKKVMSDEWVFVRRIVPFIAGAEAEACNKFCMLAVTMLHSIAEFMEDGVDNALKALADPTHRPMNASDGQLHRKPLSQAHFYNEDHKRHISGVVEETEEEDELSEEEVVDEEDEEDIEEEEGDGSNESETADGEAVDEQTTEAGDSKNDETDEQSEAAKKALRTLSPK